MLNAVLKNANIYTENGFEYGTLVIENGMVSGTFSGGFVPDDAIIFDLNGSYIFPGFADVHVHLREPGFSYKETIASGTAAAARGGYTDVCSMPNLKPAPDSAENLKIQLDIIERDAKIRVFPYATITKGQMGEELADMEAMPEAIAFSDDGRGVQADDMMEAAMIKAKELGKMIVAHCEVNDLLRGGYIHDGEYAKAHGHRGICSESEWAQIARDIELVKKTGCPYHVCHISTKESVDIIRRAKAEGVDITCETGPHYLILCDEDLQENARFKMNPPLRARDDMEALIEGIKDGTIDMLATDHAPHSAEEKGRGLEKSLMGVVGLETAFAEMYTHLVKPGVITMEKLIEIMYKNPCKRFGLGREKGIAAGEVANLTVFDVSCEYAVDPADFASMGKATPFEGDKVFGKCVLTVCDGEIAYKA